MLEHQRLDTSGLHCPLASRYFKRAITQLWAGQVLHLTTTDRAALSNVKNYSDCNLLNMVHYRRDRHGAFHLLINKPWKPTPMWM